MSRIGVWCSMVLCVLAFAVSAFAQGSSVTGRVVDPQGAAVAGVDVVLAPATGSARSTRSRADGTFTIDGVPAGTYTVRVEASGFMPFAESVTVGASAATVNIGLQVAGIVEGVTVQGALLGTANTGKTTVPVRDLPLTVNGVSSAVIAEQGVNDLVSALKNVSGVYPFTTYGVYEYYSFRGFLSSVQLVDGIRNEGNRINTQLTNIERVEVLKGPSSALYGGSALGATVNLIRKKPSAAPAYDAVAAFGNWKTGRGAFGATGRVGGRDNTLYRFDIGGEGREGYRHDEAKRLTITPSLAWRIGANNQVNVYYTLNRDQFGGDAGLPLVDTSLETVTEDNIPDVPRDRNYRTPFDEATSFDQNIQVAYARQFNGSLGFRNTLSFRRFNDKYLLSEEVDFFAPSTVDRYYLYFNHHRRPLMNVAELTAHTRKGIEQDFVFGWESQRYHNYTTLPDEDFFSAESIDAFNPVETQREPSIVITRQNVFTNTTNAFYGQDHLTLSSKVKLLLGGRADIYRRNSHSDAIEGGDVTEEGPITRRKTNALTGRAGLVVQPVPAVDLYGSYATSFTPLTQAQPDGRTLEPEKGEQWEFGQRFRMVKDRMQLNTSIYRLTRQNVAFRRTGNVFVQAGEVESKGFEADLETVPSANWRLNLGYAFTAAQFNDFEVSPGVNLRGNTPSYAPRHTFNVWAGYEWPSGFGVSGGARVMDSVFVDQDNTFAVDSYGLLNLAARYRKGPIEYSLNVNNATDTKYLIPHQDYLQVYPGEPVNVLATIRVHWN
jgi:iron complex outermembrane recepter protein